MSTGKDRILMCAGNVESRRVSKKGPREYREMWNPSEYRRRVDPG